MWHMVEDLIVLQAENSVRPAGQPRRSSWKRPPHGRTKVNTDAAFQASSAIGAFGAIIRDADGNLIADSAKRYFHIADPLTGECLAARDGLKLAAQQSLDRVILECDNLSLFNMMRENTGGRSAVYGLWQEIQELSNAFISIEFSFVHREGNGAAHVCASLPSLLEPELVWLDRFSLHLLEGLSPIVILL